MAASCVESLILAGKFEELGPALDALELEVGVDKDWPWAAHVLGHLISGSPELAKITHERAPPCGQAKETTKAAFEMIMRAQARDFPGVFVASEAEVWSSPEGAKLQLLVQHVASSQKQRALLLMQRAYTSVSVATASANLGMSVGDAVNELTLQHGWVLDSEDNKFLNVKTNAPTRRQHVAMEALSRLTEHAAAMDAGSGV